MAKRRHRARPVAPSWRRVSEPNLHGREKLAFALERFDVDAAERVALDCGASTGGFTRALLDAGARRVYAVDVGHGQLLGSLRQDPRVVNLERTNIADASTDEDVDLVTLDLSYLSLADALPQLRFPLAADAELVALVKPMFELQLGRLPDDQETGLAEATALARAAAETGGWVVAGVARSPVTGRGGAVEGLLHARRPGRS